MSHRITSCGESDDAVSSALLKGNLLGARETTRQELTGGHRARIRLLSGSRESFHGAQDLGHALRVIREQHRNLGADNGLVRASPRGPLLTGNRTSTPLQYELVEVLASHELHDLGAQGLLARTKLLGLGCQRPQLIV